MQMNRERVIAGIYVFLVGLIIAFILSVKAVINQVGLSF